MALPTAEDRAEIEEKGSGSSGSISLSLADAGLEDQPAPQPDSEPEPEPTPSPSAGGRSGSSVESSATSSTGLPNAEQRQAVEETAGTSSTSSTSSAEPEPEPEPDPAPDAEEESGSGSGTSGTKETTTMATDFQDPTEELREVSGASDAATGTHVLASGGGLLEASQTISGMRQASPDIGTIRRLLESGYTDAPSDIITKFQGGNDPNPGHTSPEEANSATTQAANTVENAGQSVAQALPFDTSMFEQQGGLLSSPLAMVTIVVAAFAALLSIVGLVEAEG